MQTQIEIEGGKPADNTISTTQLIREAPAGVYRCLTHGDKPQRIIKTCTGCFVLVDPDGASIRDAGYFLGETCRYVLADEQTVTVKFSK